MFANVIRIENNKLFNRPLWWTSLSILAFINLFAFAMMMLVVNGVFSSPPDVVAMVEQGSQWPTGLEDSMGITSASNLGGLIMMVIIGLATAQEYRHRTMQQWLMRGVNRPTLMVGKIVTIVLAIGLFVFSSMVVFGGVTGLNTLVQTGSFNTSAVDWGLIGERFAKICLTLLPYASLTFMIAILTRSPVVAIGVSVAYSLILEPLLTSILPLISGSFVNFTKFMPSQLTMSVMEENYGFVQVSIGDGPQLLEPGQAVMAILLYATVFFSIAILRFWRQDLSG